MQHGNAEISIHVDLMDKIGRLTKHLAEALNGVRVSFKAHEDHATVVVVREDFERVSACHDRCDWMVDRRQSMLQASCSQAQVCKLRVQRGYLFFALSEDLNRLSHHSDAMHGFSCTYQDSGEVTSQDLNLVKIVLAVFVQELHAVKDFPSVDDNISDLV